MLNILFPSCVKIKPRESSDQKLQWSVSPLDALPCVCGVIRKSRWPTKSRKTWVSPRPQPPGGDVWLACLARSRPIRVKPGRLGEGLSGSLKKVQRQGKGGDLLTHHRVNTFELGSRDEMERWCKLTALSPQLSPVTHYKCASSLSLWFPVFCKPSIQVYPLFLFSRLITPVYYLLPQAEHYVVNA